MAVHKPTLVQPLRPGFWTVKLMYLWEVAAEVQFLVTPLTHYDGHMLTEDEAMMYNAGPTHHYNTKSIQDLQDLLKLPKREEAMRLAEVNMRRTGESLKAWANELTSSMWRIQRTCASEHAALSLCPRLTLCQQATWSSLSPDPKSHIGDINTDSGMLR